LLMNLDVMIGSMMIQILHFWWTGKELENGKKVLDMEGMEAELPIVQCLHLVPLVASSPSWLELNRN